MKSYRAVIGICVTLLAGCAGTTGRTPVDPARIDVFGVAMHSRTDHREIRGVTGSDEPCLKGFERSFDALDIAIGYGRDGSIRKITTRNPKNSLFGIHPGDTLAAARERARQAGFVENGSPYRFTNGDLSFLLLTDKANVVFGLTLETTGP